jgi:hypothetical protein
MERYSPVGIWQNEIARRGEIETGSLHISIALVTKNEQSAYGAPRLASGNCGRIRIDNSRITNKDAMKSCSEIVNSRGTQYFQLNS